MNPQNTIILERILKKRTNSSLDDISSMDLEDMRALAEAKAKTKFSFKSFFPLIGRGNVLEDRTLSHGQVEDMLTEALRP